MGETPEFIKPKPIKQIETNFDSQGFLDQKNNDIKNEIDNLKINVQVDSKSTMDVKLQKEIGINNNRDYKKMIGFVNKNGILISDIVKFKEIFIYLFETCGKWFDDVYILNQKNPNQYIIKNSIDLISQIKIGKYSYLTVKDILLGKNQDFSNLFGNKSSICLLGWFDILDYIGDEYIISINNYVKKNQPNLDFGDGSIIYFYEFNFNLINFIARYFKSKNIQISDDNISKGIIDLSRDLKNIFDKNYDAFIFFSVDKYDLGDQFKKDKKLFEVIKKSLNCENVYNIDSSYESANAEILNIIKKLKDEGKYRILIYTSSHGDISGDSTFNDYSSIFGKTNTVFSKLDLTEISNNNNLGVCDYDKCYGGINTGINVNTVSGKYIGKSGSGLRLIKLLEKDKYTYNKAKFFQMLHANTIIYPASLIRDLNK